MIKGITVHLIEQVQVGYDEFKAPAYIDAPQPTPVENVLVSPVSAEAIVTDLQLYGKNAVYELSIPKGDTHEWEDRPVLFMGHRYRTFGPVYEYIEANTPTPWNKKVKVERIE